MTLTIDDAFETETAALTDAERGRLLLCMQRYAAKGVETELTGNERFFNSLLVFAVFDYIF